MKFVKKPVVIEAYQWFEVSPYIDGVARDVDYFRHPAPDQAGYVICRHCNIKLHDHGFIDTLEGGHRVCPGDWIITGVKGEKYACKPDIFAETYEPDDGQKRVSLTFSELHDEMMHIGCFFENGFIRSDILAKSLTRIFGDRNA